MSYVISLIIFAAIFYFTLQFFPKESERVIRQRLVPEALREQKRKRSPLSRILGPLAPINKALKMVPLRENLRRSLTAAGSSLTVNEFFTFKELCAIFLPFIYVIIVGLPNAQPLWILGLVAVGFVIPNVWLRNRVKARQNAITRALPSVLDLLNLATGAGLDFMVAVKKVVERSSPGPLVDELSQVWQETSMGKSRQDALRNLARRVNLPQISSFVRTLVQADKMGTGITEALRMQSEEVLNWRFQRGETAALKAPIKMLLPLLLFILPVVLIIVAGPILLQFLKGDFSLNY